MRIETVIAIGVAVAAFASISRKKVIAETGFSWSVFGERAIASVTGKPAKVQDLSTTTSQPILFRSYVGKERLSTSEARALIADLDAAYFANYFTSSGLVDEVIAIWRVESNLRPSAINESDPMGGAWGIGQVLAEVARQDYGIGSPQLLLDVETGARVSLAHIKSTIERLQSAGIEPSFNAWAQAYNVGVAGYARGRRNPAYLAAVTLRKVV